MFRSSVFTPELQEQGEEETKEAPAPTDAEDELPAPIEEELYFVGFSDLLLKSVFLDLNNDVMNGLANTVLTIKVVNPSDAPPAAAAAPPAKGKGAPAAAPDEAAADSIIEMSLPLSSLLCMSSGQLNVSETLQELSSAESMVKTVVSNSSIILEKSSLVWTVASDNDLAAYCLGCKVLFWDKAVIKAPPCAWGMDSPDVQDPKAKVPPTPEEFRAKYLDNVPLLVEGQGKIVSYSLSVGGPCPSSSGENDEEMENPIADFFPLLELGKGSISFDGELASTIPVDEDIRGRGDLWTLTWGSSPAIYFHRSSARKLISAIKKGSAPVLPLSMKKTAAAEANEPVTELSCTAMLDISSMVGPGCTSTSLLAPLIGEDIPEGSAPLSVSFAINASLVPKAARVNNLSKASSVGHVVSPAQVSSTEPNRDAMKEMRDEITKSIERIAQEYVAMYPSTEEVPSSSAGGGAVPKESADDKKGEFLHYLSTNGIFHELKEKLRMKVELLVRDRYGVRGRSLGKSATMMGIDVAMGSETVAPSAEETTDTLLSELYVFLMRECSTVLNAMFSNTMVDRDKADLTKNAYVNDEEKTDEQEFTQLFTRAFDAMADNRFAAAEALHLERIQLVNHSVTLGSQPSAVHDVYAKFGEFLLTQLAAEKSVDGGSNTATILLNRAREALQLSVSADETDWEVGLLYACVMIELDQQEQAEVVLNRAIEVQLSDMHSDYNMKTFVEFDGYDTDKLCPINPKCYAVLAALFSLQTFPLKARKALALANRSFVEGSYTPAVSTHGSPRRTIVLCLSDTALYLFKFAMTKLAQECVKLAKESEAAVTAKATARGKPATTVPYIKHLLLRSSCMSMMSEGAPGVEVMEVASNSELVVEEAVDKVQGWIMVADAQQFSGAPVTEVIDSFLNMMEVASAIPMDILKGQGTVPLKSFVLGGKLLISTGRFDEAISVLLFACSVYSSSTLFALLGVSLLRLDRLADAEEALVEANLLDYRNPEVWAYLSLLCLTSGPFRVEEADKCLFQALRLGLSNSALLRELATANMAVDKLQTAEDLVRRAIRHENKGNAHTRQLLANILASQNQAVSAIEQYQAIISDDGVDKKLKLEAAEKCAELLGSLGRDEELKTLANIVHTIQQEEDGGE